LRDWRESPTSLASGAEHVGNLAEVLIHQHNVGSVDATLVPAPAIATPRGASLTLEISDNPLVVMVESGILFAADGTG
jgi:hypothetical protein